MKGFEHIDAKSVDEAVSALRRYTGKARLIAGGTDLLGGLKDNIWPRRPQVIVNLKRISGLQYIREASNGLAIGPLTTLSEIAESNFIAEKYPALQQAAQRTASPLLRNLGTLAGNICQENRCWYYRYPEKLGGRIDCKRKGGERCLAAGGDHRYHSIFGAVRKCLAVNPSDMAPALVALGGEVKTTQRSIATEEFFSAQNGMKSTVLEDDEVITEIRLPPPQVGLRSAFTKVALRQTIDFAIVNTAAAVALDGGVVTWARICLNAVHNNPFRAAEAEELLIGKRITKALAQEVGRVALAKARPLKHNKYKVEMAKTLVQDTVMACR